MILGDKEKRKSYNQLPLTDHAVSVLRELFAQFLCSCFIVRQVLFIGSNVCTFVMFCLLEMCMFLGEEYKSFGFDLIFHDDYNQLLLKNHAIIRSNCFANYVVINQQ
jgi:hypothetical protein